MGAQVQSSRKAQRHLLIDFSIDYLTFLRSQRKTDILELHSLFCVTHIVHRSGHYPFIALVTFGLSQIVSSVNVFRAPPQCQANQLIAVV